MEKTTSSTVTYAIGLRVSMLQELVQTANIDNIKLSSSPSGLFLSAVRSSTGQDASRSLVDGAMDIMHPDFAGCS